jgi:hypothetical protein
MNTGLLVTAHWFAGPQPLGRRRGLVRAQQRHHDGVQRQHAAGVGDPPLARRRAWADSLPENRLHGVIAGKLYTYASYARVRRWPNGIEITGKGNTSMTNTSVSAALGLIRYAKRIDDPVSATTGAELATARLDRDDLESVPG